MTDAICEQVADAFVTVLEGISGITGLRVERDRDTEVTTFPTLVVLIGGQEADEGAGSQSTGYRMNVTVEGYAAPASQGAPPSQAANALYAAVVTALMADRTLNGLCVDIAEGETQRSFDRAEGHGPVGAFATDFEVRYFTVTGDPFTASHP